MCRGAEPASAAAGRFWLALRPADRLQTHAFRCGTGGGPVTLREALMRVKDEFPEARTQAIAGHALAELVRSSDERLRVLGMRWLVAVVVLIDLLLVARPGFAQSVEDQNGRLGTTEDPCVRTGSCFIQGAAWAQTVTIARSDLYDAMGWAGLCDRV